MYFPRVCVPSPGCASATARIRSPGTTAVAMLAYLVRLRCLRVARRESSQAKKKQKEKMLHSARALIARRLLLLQTSDCGAFRQRCGVGARRRVRGGGQTALHLSRKTERPAWRTAALPHLEKSRPVATMAAASLLPAAARAALVPPRGRLHTATGLALSTAYALSGALAMQMCM